MGSGTVLAVARSKGHQAIGFDIDPLAVLISKVWVTAIQPRAVQQKAIEVLDRAQEVFRKLPTRDAYPAHADEETRRFVAYWFDGYARRQLASLSTVIKRVRDDRPRDALWCAFSRQIISKQSGASLAMDLSHSRPHKVFTQAPAEPFRGFLAAVDRVVRNCIDKRNTSRGPAPCIKRGDARDLPLRGASIDLVLTSPPYLNAIDYMRCSKFSLVWMGHSISELRRVRAYSVGTEAGRGAAQDNHDTCSIMAGLTLRPRLGARDEAVLARYINDMRASMREAARVLTLDGRAVYVVGENTVRGTYIRNSVIVSELAKRCGLLLQKRRIRTLPANRRYLPPPTAGSSSEPFGSRLRREIVLSFTRPELS